MDGSVDTALTQIAESVGTVLQDSLDEAFRPVEDGLKRLAPTFEDAFPIWLEIGAAANEAAACLERRNKGLPSDQKVKIGDELKRRFPHSATEIARARRLTTVVARKTPGAFPLPPAAAQLPKALVWAEKNGSRPPSCLREADDLLRDYNADTIPDYGQWLAARDRRKRESPKVQTESVDVVYRRRWRGATEWAAGLERLLDNALQALAAAGGDVDDLLRERDRARAAWFRDLAAEPLLTHAITPALVPEAEAALWGAQDAVECAEPADRLYRQRELGAEIDRQGKRIFPEYDAMDRIPWVVHVLGCTANDARLLMRLQSQWADVERALQKRGTDEAQLARITVDEAIALAEPPPKEPGRRSDYFGGYAKRHRVRRDLDGQS